MKYKVEGACIVDERGAILYDLLEDMPMETRQRLAELHTKRPRLDWERAADILSKEGFALRIPNTNP